jgi:hypothetical protein
VATSGLRPLGIGEILDAAIKVFTRHWKPLVMSTLGLVTPVAILAVLVLASIDPQLLELVPESEPEEPGASDAAALAGLGVISLMAIVALIVAYAGCFKAVCDAWLGARPDARESIRYGFRRFWRVFALSVVWVAFMLVAWIPCFIPLIWFGVAWSVSVPALLFENAGPFRALGRSWQLIKGRWWASFVLVVVCYVLVSIIGVLVQMPLLLITEAVAGESAAANAVAQIISYSLSYAVTIPYFAAVLTILYFDQRVRKEGFDLQLAAEGLGIERDPSMPVPAPLVGEQYTPEQRAAAPYWPPPPGWVPPPPSPPEEPPREPWSSPSGWTAPVPDERPAEPRDAQPEPDHSRWAPPEEQPPAGGSAPPPKRKGDKDRADWLPPEAPRGPGGL